MTAATDAAAGVSFVVDGETQLKLGILDEFIEHEIDPLEEELGGRSRPPCCHTGRTVASTTTTWKLSRQCAKSGQAGFYAMAMQDSVGGGDFP